MKQTRILFQWLLAIVALTIGCAGCQRSCSAYCANQLGSDWVVVQYDYAGNPVQCWKVNGDSVQQESDGVYWRDGKTGVIIHISGWFNYVQATNNQYDLACKTLGVDCNRCLDGVYERPGQ